MSGRIKGLKSGKGPSRKRACEKFDISEKRLGSRNVKGFELSYTERITHGTQNGNKTPLKLSTQGQFSVYQGLDRAGLSLCKSTVQIGRKKNRRPQENVHHLHNEQKDTLEPQRKKVVDTTTTGVILCRIN